MKSFVVFVIANLMFPLLCLGQDDQLIDRGPAKEDAPILDKVLAKEKLAKGRGDFYMVYHTDGHAAGATHVLELRQDCFRKVRKPQDVAKLHAQNVKSACQLLPATVRFFAERDLVTIEGYQLDYDRQQAYLRLNPPVTESPCDMTRKKLFALSTQNLCRR